MGAAMTAQLVVNVLLMSRRGKQDELPHRSNRGSKYASNDFQRLLRVRDIVRCMSRRDIC